MRFMFDNEAIARNKEYDRLLTSGLLHANWMHFGFNMFSLYSFGRLMELVYSPSVLLFIYISSILEETCFPWSYTEIRPTALSEHLVACAV